RSTLVAPEPTDSTESGSNGSGGTAWTGWRGCCGRAFLAVSALGLAPGRPAAPPQSHTGLAQDAVDEPVRPAGGSGQRADGLTSGVALLQIGGQFFPVGTGHPGAFLQSLGHEYLL